MSKAATFLSHLHAFAAGAGLALAGVAAHQENYLSAYGSLVFFLWNLGAIGYHIDWDRCVSEAGGDR